MYNFLGLILDSWNLTRKDRIILKGQREAYEERIEIKDYDELKELYRKKGFRV